MPGFPSGSRVNLAATAHANGRQRAFCSNAAASVPLRAGRSAGIAGTRAPGPAGTALASLNRGSLACLSSQAGWETAPLHQSPPFERPGARPNGRRNWRERVRTRASRAELEHGRTLSAERAARRDRDLNQCASRRPSRFRRARQPRRMPGIPPNPSAR